MRLYARVNRKSRTGMVHLSLEPENRIALCGLRMQGLFGGPATFTEVPDLAVHSVLRGETTCQRCERSARMWGFQRARKEDDRA